MPDDKPPIVDAEYKIVRGPWPRWSWGLSLLNLAASSAGVVLLLILVGAGIAWLVW